MRQLVGAFGKSKATSTYPAPAPAPPKQVSASILLGKVRKTGLDIAACTGLGNGDPVAWFE